MPNGDIMFVRQFTNAPRVSRASLVLKNCSEDILWSLIMLRHCIVMFTPPLTMFTSVYKVVTWWLAKLVTVTTAVSISCPCLNLWCPFRWPPNEQYYDVFVWIWYSNVGHIKVLGNSYWLYSRCLWCCTLNMKLNVFNCNKLYFWCWNGPKPRLVEFFCTM